MSQLASGTLCHYLGFSAGCGTVRRTERLWSGMKETPDSQQTRCGKNFPACCQPGTIPLLPRRARVFSHSARVCAGDKREDATFKKNKKKRRNFISLLLHLISAVKRLNSPTILEKLLPLDCFRCSFSATRESAAPSKNRFRILLCYTKSHEIFKHKETFIVN